MDAGKTIFVWLAEDGRLIAQVHDHMAHIVDGPYDVTTKQDISGLAVKHLVPDGRINFEPGALEALDERDPG